MKMESKSINSQNRTFLQGKYTEYTCRRVIHLKHCLSVCVYDQIARNQKIIDVPLYACTVI